MDVWTSPNHRAYVAVTVHFEHEGVPISMLLDLVEVAQSHSGVNLAEVFVKILEDFGIEDKVSTVIPLKLTLWCQILSVTCDNAPNNDTMVEHLATLVENFPGAANQTCCFTHILNLVAKSILRQFNVAKKTADDPPDLNKACDALALLAEELEDGILADNNVEDDSDEDNDEDRLGDERGGMSEEDVAELKQSLIPVRLMLTKVDYII